MVIIKLIVLVTIIEATLGSTDGTIPTPSPSSATLSTPEPDEIVQTAEQLHMAFIKEELIEPTSHYRFGYEIHDPNNGTITSQTEIRYSDVAYGTYSRLDANGVRRTVNYKVDATNGFHSTLTEESPAEHTTLGYYRLASPLASASPPTIDERATFRRFDINDKEHIDKYSPHTEWGCRTHKIFQQVFHVLPTFRYNFGYEVKGTETRSQFEMYSGGAGEGRITRVNVDGCVSSTDYTVNVKEFTASKVRAFGKQDISELYLNSQYNTLLQQIAIGSSKCEA